MAATTFNMKLDRQKLSEVFDGVKIDDRIMFSILSQVGKHQAESTQSNFIEQRSPDGQKWTSSYRARAEGGLTLFDRGGLFDSIFWRTVGDDSSEVYTDWPFARVHQHGATITAKNADFLSFMGSDGNMVKKQSVDIPARPFMGFSKDDEAEIMRIIERVVLGEQ